MRGSRKLRAPTLDATRTDAGLHRDLPQHEVNNVLEITRGLAAPDDVHQAEYFGAIIDSGPEPVDTSLCGTPASPPAAALRRGPGGGRRRSVAGTSGQDERGS